MKHWMIASLALSIAGCATTEVALTGDGISQAGAGTLELVWLWPNRAEIQLDGKRYAGEWADSRCFTPQCRGVFFNVAKIHRRQIRRGSAELLAQDGTRLDCEWVSHDKKVVGTCQSGDGRRFDLKGS